MKEREELEKIDQAVSHLVTKQPEEDPLRPTALRAQPFRRVVVGIDGSAPADVALQWARELAQTTGARIELVAAVDASAIVGLGGGAGEWVAMEEQRAGEALTQASKTLLQAGVQSVAHLVHGSPSVQLVAAAEELDADLVIVGSHGRGPLGRLALGSVADGVLHRARVNVLVARRPPPATRILAAIDGSTRSRRAAAYAGLVRRFWRTRLELLHVLPPPTFHNLAPADFERVRKHVPLEATPDEVPIELEIRCGPVAATVLEVAKAEDVDLVVVGSRGLGAVRGVFMGSVSRRIVHEATASVLVVREPIRRSKTKAATFAATAAPAFTGGGLRV